MFAGKTALALSIILATASAVTLSATSVAAKEAKETEKSTSKKPGDKKESGKKEAGKKEAAAPSGPTRIQQFNAWGAYSYTSGANKVCYVLSVPAKSLPPSSTMATTSSWSPSAPARHLL